jgi:hypothetical protein
MKTYDHTNAYLRTFKALLITITPLDITQSFNGQMMKEKLWSFIPRTFFSHRKGCSVGTHNNLEIVIIIPHETKSLPKCYILHDSIYITC